MKYKLNLTAKNDVNNSDNIYISGEDIDLPEFSNDITDLLDSSISPQKLFNFLKNQILNLNISNIDYTDARLNFTLHRFYPYEMRKFTILKSKNIYEIEITIDLKDVKDIPLIELLKIIEDFKAQRKFIIKEIEFKKNAHEDKQALKEKVMRYFEHFYKTRELREFEDAHEAASALELIFSSKAHFSVESEEYIFSESKSRKEVINTFKLFGLSILSIFLTQISKLFPITIELIVSLTTLFTILPRQIGIAISILKYMIKEQPKLINSLDDFIESISKEYNIPCDPKKEHIIKNDNLKTLETFIKLITSDVEYIKSHREIDLKDITAKLKKIYLEIMSSYQDSSILDKKDDLLTRLLEVETLMYSKNNKIGKINTVDVHIDIKLLLECVVNLIGVKNLNEPYVRTILDSIYSIYARAYEGCELEIIRMLRLINDYKTKNIHIEDNFYLIYETAQSKFARAKRYTELQNMRDKIDKAINDRPLMLPAHTEKAQGSAKTISMKMIN